MLPKTLYPGLLVTRSSDVVGGNRIGGLGINVFMYSILRTE
jgi:hypothetical protein